MNQACKDERPGVLISMSRGRRCPSMTAAFRSLLTVDSLKFSMLVLVLVFFIAVFAALDELDLLPR
jgi:hypothetical protein